MAEPSLYIDRVVVWNKEITKLAQGPPPTDENPADLIEYALGDEVDTPFFTKAASDPNSIDWLDERGHVTAIFRDDMLNVRNPKPRLGALGKGSCALQPCKQAFPCSLVNIICTCIRSSGAICAWKLGRNSEVSGDNSTLRRWISTLITTLPQKKSTIRFHACRRGLSLVSNGGTLHSKRNAA